MLTEAFAKLSLWVCLTLSLSGCHGHDDNTPAAPSPDPGAVTVADLERQGKLPTLDRSAGLNGTDSDSNGVRDDIDRWIQNQPYTAPQKQAALQLARALQNTLSVDVHDDAALRAAQDGSRKAVTCVYARFPSDAQPSPNIVVKTLQKYTMNTKERVAAYLAYNDALSGSVNDMPSGDNCA